jgi:hypothetical protein
MVNSPQDSSRVSNPAGTSCEPSGYRYTYRKGIQKKTKGRCLGSPEPLLQVGVQFVIAWSAWCDILWGGGRRRRVHKNLKIMQQLPYTHNSTLRKLDASGLQPNLQCTMLNYTSL